MAERVDAYRHGSQRRRNLPTEQTGGFMEDGERAPVRYAPPIRERSGPVLSWDRGEDLERIETDATPLYITEKIHPSAFVEQLRSLEPAPLFGDFNNLPRDAEYNWYEYEGNWQNRLIHGDSVKVMASLLEKEGMAGKVQMIYMDPPYGIGFKSNMQVDTQSRNVPENAKGLPSDPQQVQTFRDTYQNGIHSYLDNLYRNFVHARELLSESGSIFMQIGSENVNRVALVLDEVFGSENRVAQIAFAKRGSSTATVLPEVADYVLWYARDRSLLRYQQLYETRDRRAWLDSVTWAAMLELPDEEPRSLTPTEFTNLSLLPDDAKLFQRARITSQHISTTGRSDPFIWKDKEYRPLPGDQWRVDHDGLQNLADADRLFATGDTLSLKIYDHESPGGKIHNLWAQHMAPRDLHYTVETAQSVVERCIYMSTEVGELVLDITCGGGTTAAVAERLGRRWITTDTSPVAIAIARQRLLAGTYDWYQLQDSAEGAVLEQELGRGGAGRGGAFGYYYHRIRQRSSEGVCLRTGAEGVGGDLGVRPRGGTDPAGQSAVGQEGGGQSLVAVHGGVALAVALRGPVGGCGYVGNRSQDARIAA